MKYNLNVPRKFHDAVAYSPDGKWVAAGCTDHSFRVWEAATSKETLRNENHTGPIMALAFSPDSRWLASASSDRTIKIWDVASGQKRAELLGHTDPLSSVAFSPDGRYVVSGAGAIRFNPGSAGEVKLWDASTGALAAELKGHTRGVSSVAFSPDGRTVASASRDNSVKLWTCPARRRRKRRARSECRRARNVPSGRCEACSIEPAPDGLVYSDPPWLSDS